MPRERKGTVVWQPPRKGEEQGHYRLRLTLDDGTRPWIDLAPGPRSKQAELTARNTAAAYTEKARKLGLVSVRAEGHKLVSASSATGETCADWFDRYIKWRTAKGFATVADTKGRIEKWVLPVIGPKCMCDVTRDDVEEVVRRLDAAVAEREEHLASGDDDEEREGRRRGISWKTATNVWGDMTHAFDEAVHSKDKGLRVLEADPTDGVRGPERGVERSKPVLYPDEVWKLLSCERVPVYWRRMYAMAIYTGARSNELAGLEAADVDLDHRTISIHKQADRQGGTKKTKTGRARVVDIEPALLPLVRALVAAAGEGNLLRMPPDEDRADLLRKHLRLAGCTREALYADDASRAPIKFHNLRDTCLTHMARRGDDPLRIQWRAGHTAFAMTEKYIAEAKRLPPTFGRPLPALPPEVLVPIVPANRLGKRWNLLSSRSHSRIGATPTGIEPVLPT